MTMFQQRIPILVHLPAALLLLQTTNGSIPLRLLLLHLDYPKPYRFVRFAPAVGEHVANTVKWDLAILVRLKPVDSAVLLQIVIKKLDR